MPEFEDGMEELLDSFIVETNELLEKLSQDLLQLEKGNTDPELLNAIFRAVHTIKGTSAFLGFDNMSRLSHKFEDVLNKLRKGELSVTSDKMDVFLESLDLLKGLLNQIESKQDDKLDLSDILVKLEVINQNIEGKGAAQNNSQNTEGKKEKSVETKQVQESKKDSSNNQSVQNKEDTPEKNNHEKSEKDETTLDAESEKNTSDQATKQPIPSTDSYMKHVDSTIRVEVNRLNHLMDLVGELVLGRNRILQIISQLNQQFEENPFQKELTDASAQIDFVTTELQMGVMKTRMVPIAKVFNKIPRLIRDLSKGRNKEVDLNIIGEETELDKSITEELNDPLTHIIRNSIDHGIESPEEREAKGKPRKGKVIVKAAHEGNNIIISIEDDGKGIDQEIIKNKAIEKGLISKNQANEMKERDALNLIFLPGFSTAIKVSDVSGRGVGMDVVKTNISKLKGLIEVESEVDKGTSFIIKLPLTLAIIQSLLVKVGGEIFAIPLDSVVEVVRLKASEIQTVNQKEVIRFRDSVLSLARIDNLFGESESAHQSSDWLYIVVVGLAEQRMGIVVDSLHGQKEIVIKSLGEYLGNIPGIAGSTILGDGRVVMILDLSEFMKLTNQKIKGIHESQLTQEIVET